MSALSASVKLLEPVIQLAQHYRLEHNNVLEAAGITAEDFNKPGARFPADRYKRVLELLATHTANPHVALSLGETTQPRMLGSIGFLMSTASSLAESYQALIDYLPLLFEGASLGIEHTPAGVVLTFELNEPHQQSIEYFLSCLINWPRWLTGHQIAASLIKIAAPQPENTQTYQRFFAAEVEFEHSVNQLVLPNSCLSLPCLDANSEMYQLHREFADSMLSASAQQTALVAQTRTLVRRQLQSNDGAIRRESIADALNLSLRTLQRRLEQLGTNFQEIYDQTRKEQCLQLIQHGQGSFGEIAYQLGFSNQSAFQKAFKRWLNTSPSQYRKQIQPAQTLQQPTSEQPHSEQADWLTKTNLQTAINEKIEELNDFSLDLLEWASIIGSRFTLQQLSDLTQNPVARLAIHLWPSEQLGLIISNTEDNTGYQFSHLDIHDQLYNRLTEKEKKKRRLLYGKLLQNQLSATPSLQELEPVLHHLNYGYQYQSNPQLLSDLNKLNKYAAELCQQQKKYVAASTYLMEARALLTDYQSPQNIELLLSQTEYLLLANKTEQARDCINQLRQHPLSILDNARTTLLDVHLDQIEGLYESTISKLHKALQALEIKLPESSSSQLQLLLSQVDLINHNFNGQNLAEHNQIVDPNHLIQLQLLERLSSVANHFNKPVLSAVAIGKMTEITLEYGASPYTAFSFIGYSWVTSWFCGDYILAQFFAAQGKYYLNDSTSKELISPTQHTRASLEYLSRVHHWISPVASQFKELIALQKSAFEHAEWLSYGEATLIQTQMIVIDPKPLTEQLKNYSDHQQQLAQQGQLLQAERLQVSAVNFIKQLTQETKVPAQPIYKNGYQASLQILSALILNQQHLWPSLYSWQASVEVELSGYLCISQSLFAIAMMKLIDMQQANHINPKTKQDVLQIESRLALWSKQKPENFSNQLLLIQAELAKLTGKNAAVMFEKLLLNIRKHPTTFMQAYAYERYASYLHQQQQYRLSQFCLDEAKELYKQWGATAKLKQLEQSAASLAEYY